MARDEDEGDERGWHRPPLPPDDRVWRHPSELAGGTSAPSAWIAPTPIHRRRPVLALAGACLTGAAITCGLLWLTRPTWVRDDEAATPPRAAAATSTSVASFVSAGLATADLADALAPHLVQVEAKVGATWSSGTGLRLAGADGIVVASPLVQGAGFVAVTGSDRRRVDARVLAADDATATAVLATDADDPSADVLLASPASPGQLAAVVGARSTAVGGVAEQRVVPTSISAVGARVRVGDAVLHDAIELDRSLPVDALGAAVVDGEGHLLGIVVATSTADGMAVAVPGRAALGAAADLAQDGEVHRAWLGVEAVDLDPASATVLGVDGGATLTQVDPGSPAAEAGLAEGDVITGVGDEEVLDASDLVLAIRDGEPGGEVEVRWHRGATAEAAEVTLGG
ncbi:MAG: serine protease [Acidimicrobiales bacterium]|nr:serine protease [Acidimicrobiales bacterium]HRW36521.1 S1C family serine protease [Aquihabitans sp.]